MAFWNSWGDTAQRLFEPLGGDADNSNAPWWDIGGNLQKDPGAAAEAQRKDLLYQQAAAAGGTADQQNQEFNYNQGQQKNNMLALQQQANGQNSVSAEQLRQAMLRNQATQQSMAAGAAPQNAASAARTAAIQSGRQDAGLAGQQAVAGLAERNQAQTQYTGALQGYGAQALQASQGARGQALQGYGAQNAGAPEKSNIDKYGNAIVGGLGAIFSDRRLKTDVKEGDDDANKMLDALKSYSYRYKDEDKLGAGKRTGVMAQDLERGGMAHAVVDTPGGKMVDSGHLSTANTAMIAALHKRLKLIESKVV